MIRLLKFAMFCGLLGLSAGFAVAQTQTSTITLTWTPPTQNSNGTAVTGTLTYNIYEGSATGSFSKVANALTGSSTALSSLTAGPCFVVTTVETTSTGAIESPLSNTTCVEQPLAPGNIVITVATTVK